MTVTSDNRILALQRIYGSDEVAKRLFDQFANRQKDRRETTASAAATIGQCPYAKMVKLLKELARIGVGTFKSGRRGHDSRMVWQFSIRSIGLAARGTGRVLSNVSPNVGSMESDESEEGAIEIGVGSTASDSSLIRHDFQLRPEFRAEIVLPSDITGKEAERLAGFIRQVPFDA